MNYSPNSEKRKLDENHTHFILVEVDNNDDDEIEFRAKLEDRLRQPKQNKIIPSILIVVEGGENTLKTVAETLNKNIPVLVLKVSIFFFSFF